jgi:RNA polymerase sigma-70 factor (ECF subfamily)
MTQHTELENYEKLYLTDLLNDFNKLENLEKPELKKSNFVNIQQKENPVYLENWALLSDTDFTKSILEDNSQQTAFTKLNDEISDNAEIDELDETQSIDWNLLTPEERYELFFSKTGITFEQAYSNYYKKLNWFLLTMIKDKEKAEDFTSDALIKSLNKIHLYQPKCSYITWLFTIAKNLVKDSMNKNKKQNTTSISTEIGDASTLEDLIKFTTEDNISKEWVFKEKVSVVNKAIEELEDHAKEIIILRDIRGLKYKEISKILNINTNAAKCRVMYSRNQIKQKVKTIFKYLDSLDTLEDYNWTY